MKIGMLTKILEHAKEHGATNRMDINFYNNRGDPSISCSIGGFVYSWDDEAELSFQSTKKEILNYDKA